MREEPVIVKENSWSPRGAPLPWWALGGAAALSALALAAVGWVHSALPPPLPPLHRGAPPDRFNAHRAHEHLVNLTSIGPRVAGSYENEVLAVGVVVAAVRGIARAAEPHHRIDLDVHAADGAFPITFLDGMNNVYRGVQSVVVRVTAAGGAAGVGGGRNALLFNCHFDTVPDSPGASDDGAGCAVLLETLRALTATRRPLRHPAIFLFNGAEENIMQASHAFITTHKWAGLARAFINIEACGSGGREVLFQAGPRDPWLLDAYAHVPRPFASSLAQELFQSGLIPADTDFRIFRDFGNLSGVDLAWSSNGYVYHTRLDTPDRVPRAALQRTGDNVLALAHDLLSSGHLSSAVEEGSQQPVFFDMVGVGVVSADAARALAALALSLALAALNVHLSAGEARNHLYLRRVEWWRCVCAAVGCGGAGAAAGVLAALAIALLLHALGARMLFYNNPWLLAPFYAVPALCVSWLISLRAWRGWCGSRGAGVALRGWWGGRAWHAGGAGAAALAAAACAARGLRSGFLPLLWALPPALVAVAAARLPPAHPARPLAWLAGYLPPVLQTCYLALGSLTMFVPVMGRAGNGHVPADVSMALIVSVLTLAACGWMLPFLVSTRNPHRLIYVLLCWSAACAACGACWCAPYSEARPQRVMLFHTRRTHHRAPRPHSGPGLGTGTGNGTDRVDYFYWMPDLDANSPHSLLQHVPELGAARAVSREECARWVYCGAPYYLPVLSLIARSHAAPAPRPPRAALHVRAHLAAHNATAHRVTLELRGCAHVVVVCAPAPGARLVWTSLLPKPLALAGPRWHRRDTYFFAMHDARTDRAWNLTLLLQHEFTSEPERWIDLSVAGHALFGDHKLHDDHRRLLAAMPPWVAATGWGVDLHLYTL